MIVRLFSLYNHVMEECSLPPPPLSKTKTKQKNVIDSIKKKSNTITTFHVESPPPLPPSLPLPSWPTMDLGSNNECRQTRYKT